MEKAVALLSMKEYDDIFENEFGIHYHKDHSHLTKCRHYHDFGLSPMLITKLSHKKANLFRIFEKREKDYPMYICF